MPTISEALAIAVEHHQAGRLQPAEQLYRQILQAEPDHPQAWHLLGVASAQLGRHQAGVECIRRALALAPDWPDANNNLGNVLREQGRLEEAAACYRRALELRPDHAEAWSNLGSVLSDQGKWDEAIACCRRAVELKPDSATAHNNLGIALHGQGKFSEATACYHRALVLKPGFAEAHSNLGNALKGLGKLDEAVASYRRAVELKPNYAGAHNNLGTALQSQGKLDEAVACFRRALELRPDHAEAHSHLGGALSGQGKWSEAIACCRRAIELKPESATAHNNLGIALGGQGKLDEAVASYRRALELKSDFVEAYTNLGNTLNVQGKWTEAVACCRRAIELKPNVPEAHNALGSAFVLQGKFDEAVACYRRAVELNPDYPQAHGNLGAAWKAQGKLDEAVASYRRALDLKPDFTEAHSNLLFALQYGDGVTPAELAAAHAEYDRLHARPLRAAWRPHEGGEKGDRHHLCEAGHRPEVGRGPFRQMVPVPFLPRVRERPVRLGFVSPDFGRHPVGFFLIRLLENLDRNQCETVCYSDRKNRDGMTARLQAAAALWRDAVGLSDEQLAEQIRADRIDVLVDLAGHTADNRLLVFARKPAPIQVTWCGYPGTTGLSAIDYILADRYTIPPGAEHDYCERVLRMPDGFLCFAPPDGAPPVSPLPAMANGYMTFAAFHNPPKITPRVAEVWARILKRLPGSRLVLKYRGMDNPSVSGRLAEEFAGQGVDRARLDFRGFSAHTERFADYHRVDVALDPFPYNGCTTTCEALWMGVPVVTCPGETFASRCSLSHLSTIGLTETVARDLDEYVEIAVALGSDLPRLAGLRAGLRERMAVSPLCDGKRFAAHFAAILRGVWHNWCDATCGFAQQPVQ